MPQSFIRDSNGVMVDANAVQVPNNRDFRSAWVKDPNAPVIEVDMDKARAYYKDKAAAGVEREMRENLTPAWVDAEFNGDAAAKAALQTKRGNANAKKNEAAIDNAQNPNALKALWDEDLMGKPWWAPED
jgi:hypothetical protein